MFVQILQALWDSMQSSVDTCFSAAGKQPPSLRNKSFNRSKKITFSTLHDCIRGFMDTLGLTKFVLVMDHIDYLRSLDADVANKLLLMSEVSQI